MVAERKRPLGLGATGTSKAAKLHKDECSGPGESTELGQDHSIFQLPDGDLTEEAEVYAFYTGAATALAQLAGLDEEELAEQEQLDYEDRLRTRAEKLLYGVVHECDRILKLHDLEAAEDDPPVPAEIFELMGDGLFRIGLLASDAADLSMKSEYFEAAREKYEAGLALHPSSANIKYSLGRLALFQKILSSGVAEIASLDLPALEVTDQVVRNVPKIWHLATQFTDDEQPTELLRLCADIIPKDLVDSLDYEIKIQRASWIARLAESLLDRDDEADLEKVRGLVADLESAISCEQPDDPDAQIVHGELTSKMHLLRGSLCSINGDEVGEQQCYHDALTVFEELSSTFGIPIPDYILQLTQQD